MELAQWPTSVNCQSAQAVEGSKHPHCAANKHGGCPSLGVCGICADRDALDPDKPAICQITNPIPRPIWPAWAKLAATRAVDADVGIGDVVARHVPAGETFKAVYKKVVGKSCGCDERQDELNRKYPLK